MYLLDTNAWIAYSNPGPSAVVDRIRQRAANELCLCSVVRAELHYGAYKSPRSAQNLALLRAVVVMFPTCAFDDQAADHYGQIRAHLEAIGRPIGPNDTMIAAVARANNFIVVAHDTKEFSLVPALAIEDWEAP
jgi:tRNA(fMet)-specific endonuclease VapC